MVLILQMKKLISEQFSNLSIVSQGLKRLSWDLNPDLLPPEPQSSCRAIPLGPGDNLWSQGNGWEGVREGDPASIVQSRAGRQHPRRKHRNPSPPRDVAKGTGR